MRILRNFLRKLRSPAPAPAPPPVSKLEPKPPNTNGAVTEPPDEFIVVRPDDG